MRISLPARFALERGDAVVSAVGFSSRLALLIKSMEAWRAFRMTTRGRVRVAGVKPEFRLKSR